MQCLPFSFPGEIQFSKHMTVRTQKAELHREILPPVQFTHFSVDKQFRSITETKVTVHGRKIPFLDIRKEIIKHHGELELLRVCTEGDSEISHLSSLKKHYIFVKFIPHQWYCMKKKFVATSPMLKKKVSKNLA